VRRKRKQLKSCSQYFRYRRYKCVTLRQKDYTAHTIGAGTRFHYTGYTNNFLQSVPNERLNSFRRRQEWKNDVLRNRCTLGRGFLCLRMNIFSGYAASRRLGGVVVTVLATGPKVCRFEPGQGDEFLRATEIRSTPYPRMGSKAGRSHVVRFCGM
jgi:hypothetical protein